MKLQYFEHNDILFVDKPAGFSTAGDPESLQGIYQTTLKQPLWAPVALDRQLTGALLLTKSEAKAAELKKSFAEGQVLQKYRFVTDQKSEIENEPLVLTAADHQTKFLRIKRSPHFELWEVESRGASSLNIRKLANEFGLAILGDTENGGNAFPHLCLHSFEIQIPGEKAWNCAAPLFFDRLNVLPDVDLVEILAGFDRRERLYSFLKNPELCLRLSHLENANVRWDVLGPVLWGQWYGLQDPTSEDLVRAEVLAHRTHRKFVLQRMQNRGKDPLQKNHWLGVDDVPERWQAVENGMKFNFARDRGLSSGLFLDQRHNRLWVKQNCEDQTVLNLFAYTCGFSLAAALGGAKQVTSVDVSSEFLSWGKENFAANDLDTAKSEFFVQDSVFFLERSVKKERKFDLIICDPPTFGRHKEGVFRLEKDWKKLLALCHQCLSPGGVLLFSTNFEQWDFELWKNKINETKSWRLMKNPQPDFDYEGPGEERLLKSFFLQRK